MSLLVGFLFFAFVGKLLRVIVWGAMAGPAMGWHGMGGSWRHPWHRMHGPAPPWSGLWHEHAGESSQGSEDGTKAEA
jgi:hypothetical protein